jgi:fatty-acyl-CoA synthase
VTALLDAHAASAPDAPAISFPDRAWSYVELAQASVDAARGLKAAGVSAGDRVGILLREASAQYVAFGLGIIRLGAICVPINARNKARELAGVLRHADLRLLLADGTFARLIAEAGVPDGYRTVIVGEDAGFDAAGAEVSLAEVRALERVVARDTAALLLYTSGTTAAPRGCLHSHATMLAAGYNTSSRLGMQAEDRFWTPLTMFHVGGWQGLLSALSVGACFSHVGLFAADAALAQLERERCTIAMPAFELIWMSVLDHLRFSEADLSALRVVMNVGVPERLQRMQQALPGAIQVSMIGLTEACGSVCIGAPTDSLYSRMHTCGSPLSGTEVRVVDPGSGTECPTGTAGELLFRGPTRFLEYYRDPVGTAEVIDADGWVHTGDLARAEVDGSFTFLTRLKDVLKIGGENASAAEIEGYLITHPAVATAAVVAAPDSRYGEVPCAFVQRLPGAEVTERELIDYCLGAIATFKVPRYVRFVDEYPVSASQKIQKYVLRERIEVELRERGLSAAPRVGSGR